MSQYSIEVISTKLPGNNGHAGVQIVDQNKSVVASIHGGPATGIGSSQRGFGNSAYRDDVPLVVNMGGANFSFGDQGYNPEHRQTLVSGLTQSQAVAILSDAGDGASIRFGTDTAYQAAYHPLDLPLYERITGAVVAGNQNALYQNSNSVAYVVAREVEFYAEHVYQAGTITPIVWEDWPVELPGYLGGWYGELQRVDASVPDNHCFLSNTPIQMWPLLSSLKPRSDGSYDERQLMSQVWEKPISKIKVGDVVLAYDAKGRLAPKQVLRTMENRATHILDFWGTGVTPGHAYYCADGKFQDRHVPLMDILRTDGAIMRADGTMVRAATNCEVGSMGDIMIYASANIQKPDGSWTGPKPGQIRFGTRVIMPDGKSMSLMEIAATEGWRVSDDGYMVGMLRNGDGSLEEQRFHFPYIYGEHLPSPEDYILARSAVTLEEIYAAGEWEQIGTQMRPPERMVGLNANYSGTGFQPTKPKSNTPPAFRNHPDAPRNTEAVLAFGQTKPNSVH